jgi:hypothetical protein
MYLLAEITAHLSLLRNRPSLNRFLSIIVNKYNITYDNSVISYDNSVIISYNNSNVPSRFLTILKFSKVTTHFFVSASRGTIFCVKLCLR